ncbi:MAG: hypothetical protein AAF182_03430 [Pseudomonadota bacterium]
MSETSIWEIVFAIIGAFGGAGAIILALSSWFGKVWANRIMQSDKAKHDSELEKLRANLLRENNKDIEHIRNELDIFKQQHLTGFHDKTKIYRMVVDLVAEVLSNYDLAFHANVEMTLEQRDATNRTRMRVYGYLAIVAPEEVLDAYSDLSDFLMDVAGGKEQYHWPTVRKHILPLLSKMRQNLGFEKDEITYKGHR